MYIRCKKFQKLELILVGKGWYSRVKILNFCFPRIHLVVQHRILDMLSQFTNRFPETTESGRQDSYSVQGITVTVLEA